MARAPTSPSHGLRAWHRGSGTRGVPRRNGDDSVACRERADPARKERSGNAAKTGRKTPRSSEHGAVGRGYAPDTRAVSEAVAPMASACRSEEHTSEIQSLMRISYAVLCLKKKTKMKHKAKDNK